MSAISYSLISLQATFTYIKLLNRPTATMPTSDPLLFSPFKAGDLQLANRIVMAPLTRNRAPGAIPTPLMAEYYTQRASAGLLITEATDRDRDAEGGDGQVVLPQT